MTKSTIEKVAAKYKIGDRIDITADFEIVKIPEANKIIEHGKSTEDKAILKSVVEKATKSTDQTLEYGEVIVVVSNSGTDRYGDSIIAEGIELTQIRRNPVVLWAHQYSSLPIGQIKELWLEDGNLMAKIKLEYDVYDFADTVYKMILRGTIRAVSIGGLIIEFGETEDGKTDYYKIEKLEMVELSVVPVGAHPDALVTSKSIGIDRNAIEKQFNDFVRKSMVDKFKNVSENEVDDHVKSLEAILAALKETKSSMEQQDSTAKQKTKLITLKRLAGEADYEVGKLNKTIKIKLKGK